MNERIKINTPSLCSNEMICDYTELANKIVSLDRDDLEIKIRNAQLLGFLYTSDNILVSVGCIKQIRSEYTSQIFERAGVQHLSPKYPIELGYFYTKSNSRGQGFSRQILIQLLTHCKYKNVYATISEDNIAAIRLFTSQGFRQIGNSWHSRLGSYDVKLFLKENV